jgi:hypothetical protein
MRGYKGSNNIRHDAYHGIGWSEVLLAARGLQRLFACMHPRYARATLRKDRLCVYAQDMDGY